MQKDFHYYCVAVLARAAGFPEDKALAIAYASQYVDDAVEGERIPIHCGGTELCFEGVRTAYQAPRRDSAELLTWPAQKRVLVPFHFLPPTPFSSDEPGAFSFVTSPDSDFANLLLDEAMKETLDERLFLCRLGIAIHTYADTWAHRDFTGIEDDDANDVERLELVDPPAPVGWEFPGYWLKKELSERLAPKVGHAQAWLYPDFPFQHFRYDCPARSGIDRDNRAGFLDAAEMIYTRLARTVAARGYGRPAAGWAALRDRVWELFCVADEDVNARCRRWKDAAALWDGFSMNSVAYCYSDQTWRADALEGDSFDWKRLLAQDWTRIGRLEAKPGFWNSYWVQFHRAALKQRHFVLERLP